MYSVLFFLLYLRSKVISEKHLTYFSEIFTFISPKNSLNIDLEQTNLHRGEKSRGPTYLPNLVFLGAIGANREGGRIDPPPTPCQAVL